MFDISPFTNYIYLGIAIPSILGGLKIVFNSPYLKEKAKAKTVETKSRIRGDGALAKLQDYIQNGEKHIATIEREQEELRKQGVSDEQMGHLNFEKNTLKTLQHPVVQILSDPAIQIAKKFAKNWGVDL